jgi:hypothetical protein
MQLSCSPHRNIHIERALRFTPGDDASGFWKTVSTDVGRAYSSTKIAVHQLANGVLVQMTHYTPGPLDALTYGETSALATPRSTYSVYCQLSGVDESLSSHEIMALLKRTHPGVDSRALARASITIWSPDGEAQVFAEFKESDMDFAFLLGASLPSIED